MLSRYSIEQVRSIDLSFGRREPRGALDADIVVEGIETADQLALLKRLGCRFAQGYLIGRPQRLEDVLQNARSRLGGELSS